MRQESGRSMVEIIGVIAIMALMSAGAFMLIRSGMASQRRSMIIDDVSKIVSGIRSLYSDYDDLATLDGDGAMAAMGVNKNGPDGVIYSVAKVAGNKKFKVTISGLSSKDCEILKTKAWSDSDADTTPNPVDLCGNNKISIIYKK